MNGPEGVPKKASELTAIDLTKEEILAARIAGQNFGENEAVKITRSLADGTIIEGIFDIAELPELPPEPEQDYSA